MCRLLVLSVHVPRVRRVQVPSPQCAWPQGQACAGSESSVCVVTGAGVYRFLVLSVRGHGAGVYRFLGLSVHVPRGRRVQVLSPQCAWSRGRRVQVPRPQCACPQGQVPLAPVPVGLVPVAVPQSQWSRGPWAHSQATRGFLPGLLGAGQS